MTEPDPSDTADQPSLWPDYLQWQFYIDVVGGCNLACPSCPVGNSREVPVSKGLMPPELLDRIVAKAVAEVGEIDIGLYNWTEPLLHPQLPELVRIIHSHRCSSSLSSNLNDIRNLEEVLRANPGKIKLSLSGFVQSSYGVTHRKGDIEVVKRNMQELAEVRRRVAAETEIVVGFHRYLGNHEEERLMEEYSDSLGFTFDPQWAFLMPLEKVLGFCDAEGGTPLSEEDGQLIERLALPLAEAVRISQASPQQACLVRDRIMSITVDGNVTLCCNVFDQSKYSLCSYLDHTLDEIQAMKHRHWQCQPCMEHGLHKLYEYTDAEALDHLALKTIASHFPNAQLSGMQEISRRRRYRGLMGLARRVKDCGRLVLDRLAGRTR